jgi:UMP-CMP kinase
MLIRAALSLSRSKSTRTTTTAQNNNGAFFLASSALSSFLRSSGCFSDKEVFYRNQVPREAADCFFHRRLLASSISTTTTSSSSSSSDHEITKTPSATKEVTPTTRTTMGGKASKVKKSNGANHPTVVFVLGGPGAGKGTQCANIVRDYKFTHLSAGDLLRAHMKSGTKDGNMVAQMIKDGKIVPSSVTVKLLLSAMEKSGSERFLIDGFPRNKENRDAWVEVAGYDCEFVLMYDCTEEVMLERLLGRNEGRTDDNVESIKKRFVTFRESSMPVVEFYEKLGKVRKVNAIATPAQVYEKTKESFKQFAA